MRIKLTGIIAFLILFAYTLSGCQTTSPGKNAAKIDSLVKLAEAADSLQDLPKAIQYYTQVLAMDSINLFALVNRGRAYVWKGELAKGFADYNKAVRLYPSDETYLTRGMAYVSLNQYDRAAPDIEKSLELNPSFGGSFYGMSFIEESRHHLDSAIRYCNKADAAGYIAEQVWRRRAELLEKEGNYKAAINDINSLINFDGSNAGYYNNRGYDRSKLQQYEEAVKDLDTALKLTPSMAFAHNNKAAALLKLNKFSEALAEVNLSLQLNAKNTYAVKNRAEIYIALNEKDKACTDLKSTRQMNMDDTLEKEIERLEAKACQ